MEKAIVIQNRHWREGKYKKINERDILEKILKKLKLKEIEVITGVRRSGKSTLLRLIINKLIESGESPNKILFVNIEEPDFLYEERRENLLLKIIESSEKITGVKPEFLFFDEIQFLDKWEIQIKSLYETGMYKKIFITGSNSNLLAGDYAKLLSGRYTINKIYPYSYREILNINSYGNLSDLFSSLGRVKKIVDEMMFYGSFPEILKHKDYELKKELLISYFDTIVYKDCIAGFNIRENKNFKDLIAYLIRNIGTLYSYNSIAKQINGNENSIKQYIRILEANHLIKEILFYSDSFKKQMRENKKAYIVDNSFLTLTYSKNLDSKGRLFENLVFTELLKRGYEIFYYKEQGEIDFIVEKDNKVFAIQATYELKDNNFERELKRFKKLMERVNIKEGIILTYEREDFINGIRIIPFFRYFFEEF